MKDTLAMTDAPAGYANYGWIITEDLITEDLGSVDFPPRNDTNLLGPRNISPMARAELDDGEGAVFRLLDDDMNVYYKGRIVGGDYTGFEPMDDFGTPNAGCVHIEYWEGKEWRPL